MAHPAFYSMVTGLFPGQGMKMTPNFHLEPRFIMNGAKSQFPNTPSKRGQRHLYFCLAPVPRLTTLLVPWHVYIVTFPSLYSVLRKIHSRLGRTQRLTAGWNKCNHLNSMDRKYQLDVTFCILYFSSNSCSTCFGQPCAHHQKLTTAWCYSLVLVCAVAAGRWSSPVGR